MLNQTNQPKSGWIQHDSLQFSEGKNFDSGLCLSETIITLASHLCHKPLRLTECVKLIV